MADKSSFTADEWKLLLESVMMTSIAITAAEPPAYGACCKKVLRAVPSWRRLRWTPERMRSLKQSLPISEPLTVAVSRGMA